MSVFIDLDRVYPDDSWQYATSKSEVISFDVDTSELGRCISRYLKDLDATERELLPEQFRLLMEEIVLQSPPRSRSKAQERIRKNVKAAFYQKPRESFTGRQAKGQDGIRWLYASAKYVVGIEPQFVKLDVTDGKELSKLMAERTLGAKWFAASSVYAGKVNRGHSETELFKGKDPGQRDVWFVRKPMISRGAYSGLMKAANVRPGTLKASWVKAAASAGVKVRAPQWVLNNIDRSKGRGGCDLVSRNKYLYAISSSPGVSSVESRAVVQAAVRTRVIKLSQDIDNQLQGVYKRSFKR